MLLSRVTARHRVEILPRAPGAGRAEPDCRLLLAGASGEAAARCSCWWTGVPRMDGRQAGAIGHFDAGGIEAGTALLAAACARLQEAGCDVAVGPLDGSTWHSYRLVTESRGDPPFFLEPWTPAACAAQWAAAGFTPIARYTSAVAQDLSAEDPRAARAWARLESDGVRIRHLDAADAEADLKGLHQLCLESLAANFLFTPIGEAAFLDLYRPLLGVVRPELVLIAERHSKRAGRSGNAARPCGVLFAVPDALQAARGGPADTVIIKTVAVARHAGVAGLGAVLVSQAHRVARGLGFRRAIHALMHERNPSRNLSRRYAVPFRRYALLARPLQGES